MLLPSRQGVINILNRRATGFLGRAKLFGLTLFCYWKKISTIWLNQVCEIILRASLFAWCLVLNQTPGLVGRSIACES